MWREAFTPFGESINPPSANTDRQGYTGHIRDTDTGLTYMQARYYDPVIGRFLSNDPVGFAEGGVDYFNRYAYAFNDPVNLTDPDGRSPLAPAIACARVAPCRSAAIATGRTVAKGAARAASAIGNILNPPASTNTTSNAKSGVDDDGFVLHPDGKLHGNDKDTGDIEDEDLEDVLEVVKQSIETRSRENERFDRGNPNGDQEERRKFEKFQQHKDQIAKEQKWAEQITRRMRELTENSR